MPTAPEPPLDPNTRVLIIIGVCVVGALVVMFSRQAEQRRQWAFQKKWGEMGTFLYTELRRG